MLGVRFRPQVSGELVAAETTAARAGEQGQECERLTARGGAAALGAVSFHCKPAEHPHCQHWAPFDPFLTGSLPERPNLSLVYRCCEWIRRRAPALRWAKPRNSCGYNGL